MKKLWREDSKDGLKTGRNGRRKSPAAAETAAAETAATAAAAAGR